MSAVLAAAALDMRDLVCVIVVIGAMTILAAHWYADLKRTMRKTYFHKVPNHTRFHVTDDGETYVECWKEYSTWVDPWDKGIPNAWQGRDGKWIHPFTVVYVARDKAS